MRQVWHGLSRRGIPNRLIVGTMGKTSAQDASPLYPRAFDRLQYTRFQPVIERLFPRFPSSDRHFRNLSRSDVDILNIHNFHEEFASLESLANLSREMPVVWTAHCTWPVTGGCLYPKDCLGYMNACGQCPQLGAWPIGNVDGTARNLRRKIEILSQAQFTVIAPSHHMAARMAKSPVGKNWEIEVIHNGVDIAEFKFARKRDADFRAKMGMKSPQKPVVCIVIRDFKTVHKGFPDMLKAVELCQARNYTLALAGENSGWAAAQIPPDIEVLDAGFLDRRGVADLMEASDIFLFASPAENLPCAILEAMASKACIVSTPTDGVLEEVNGECAFLSAGFDGETLGKALEQALLDRPLAAQKTEAAFQRVVEVFSEEKMIDGYIRVFESKLNSFSRLQN